MRYGGVIADGMQEENPVILQQAVNNLHESTVILLADMLKHEVVLKKWTLH